MLDKGMILVSNAIEKLNTTTNTTTSCINDDDNNIDEDNRCH